MHVLKKCVVKFQCNLSINQGAEELDSPQKYVETTSHLPDDSLIPTPAHSHPHILRESPPTPVTMRVGAII